METEPAARFERSSTDVSPVIRARLETLDAVIVSGLPGKIAEAMGLEAAAQVFPSTTTDLMKVLREQGVKVDFEVSDAAHELVSHKAADWWIPVGVFLETGGAHAAGDLMARAIASLLGRRRAENGVLHVKFGRVTRRGDKIEWLEAHGKGTDVLRALKEFRD